jgi:hypothetical protein
MVKIECEVCHKEGYLQRIGNNYFRVRHYAGKNPQTGKAKFYYHQQTKNYTETQLALKNTKGKLKQKSNNIDRLNNTEHLNLSKSSLVSSGCSLVWLGHQPATLTTRVRIPATAPFLHTILASSTLCYTLVRLRSDIQPEKNAKPKPRRATKDNHGNGWFKAAARKHWLEWVRGNMYKTAFTASGS